MEVSKPTQRIKGRHFKQKVSAFLYINNYFVAKCHRTPNAIQSDTERNLIGRRTESDRAADGI